jgi:rhodanese-related sulfurtransferase
MIRYCLIILLLILGFSNAYTQNIDPKFEEIIKRHTSGLVPFITVNELRHSTIPYSILDAREPEEFAVSHLKNAKNIRFKNLDLKVLEGIDKNSPVLVYCSIGVRSEIVGLKLKEMGYTSVKNLYGSIFEWVNQGYPVYDSKGKLTPKVHAYDKLWGVWLKKGLKVY